VKLNEVADISWIRLRMKEDGSVKNTVNPMAVSGG